MWTRDLAASIGVTVPLHACEHYYVLFQDVPGLDPSLPVLRDYDHCSYFKYDAGKLLVGAFEPNARPWGMGGIPDDFSFGEICGRLQPFRAGAARRHAPHSGAEQAGIQKFFCGPESFTPDVRYHLGESAELAQLLRRGRLELDRAAIRRRHRQGDLRMDSRRPSADGSLGGRRPAQHAVPDQPQISAGAGQGEPGSAVCHALSLPPVRDGARRAQIRRARPVGGGGCMLRRSVRLGTRQLVRAGRGEGGLRVQLWAPELVRTERPRAPQRPRAVGLFDQSSFAKFRLEGPRCGSGAESRLRERRGRGAGQDRLYAVVERARRHRGGSDRDAALTDTLI